MDGELLSVADDPHPSAVPLGEGSRPLALVDEREGQGERVPSSAPSP